VREQGLPSGGGADPDAGGDDRDGRPAGSADSAARTAAAGLPPAAGATGAGAGSVAASAAMRAACGAGFLVRAMMMTPFLFSGAIPVSVLTAPIFSGRQLLWSSREVKQLRDNSRYYFRPVLRTRHDAISPFPRQPRLSALKSPNFPSISALFITHRT
jgi:hypothetical protein